MKCGWRVDWWTLLVSTKCCNKCIFFLHSLYAILFILNTDKKSFKSLSKNSQIYAAQNWSSFRVLDGFDFMYIYMNRVLNEARERGTQQNPIQSNQFLMSVFVTFCHFCVLHLWLVRNWPINHSREPLNSPSFRHVYMYVWWYIIYKYIIHVDVIIWYIYIQGRQENTGKITQFATFKLYDNTYYIYKYDYDE